MLVYKIDVLKALKERGYKRLANREMMLTYSDAHCIINLFKMMFFIS